MKLSWQSKSSIIFNIAFVLSVMALAWWPVNPLDVYSIKVTNPGEIVTTGHPVLYEVKFHKWAAKKAIVHRQLINSRTIHYTPYTGNLPVSKETVDTKANYLETSSSDLPGVYYIRITYTFKYFFFREVDVVADSAPFLMIAHHDELTEGKEGKEGPRGKEGKEGERGKDFWGR